MPLRQSIFCRKFPSSPKPNPLFPPSLAKSAPLSPLNLLPLLVPSSDASSQPPPLVSVAHEGTRVQSRQFSNRTNSSASSRSYVAVAEKARVGLFAFDGARLIALMRAAFFACATRFLEVARLAAHVACMAVSMVRIFLQVIYVHSRNTFLGTVTPPPRPPSPQPKAMAIVRSTASPTASDTVEAFLPSLRTIPHRISTPQIANSPISSPRFARLDRGDDPVSSPDCKKNLTNFRFRGPKQRKGEHPASPRSPTNAPARLPASGDQVLSRLKPASSPSNRQSPRMNKSSEESPSSKPSPDSLKKIRSHHDNYIRCSGKKQHTASGNALSNATIGLFIGLSALLAGRVFALIGVICWWYVSAHLKSDGGNRPTSRRVGQLDSGMRIES